MEVLYLLLVFSFVGYNVYSIVKDGVPTSFSATFFTSLPNKEYSKAIWYITFSFWGISTAILAQSGFMLAAAFGICLVGAAPDFRKERGKESSQERKAHLFGAGFSALMSFLHLIIVMRLYHVAISLIIVDIIILIISDKRTLTYWLEIASFITIFVTLGFKI